MAASGPVRLVMSGFMSGIHVFMKGQTQDVDGPNKSSHNGRS
jgi:hypothetical protein